MKCFLRQLQFLTAGILLAGALSAQEEIRAELEALKTRTDAKLHDLFAHRDTPIPPVDGDINPFFRSLAPPPPPPEKKPEAPVTPPTRKDSELLAEIAETLVINGIVKFNNRNLVVINQAPTPAGRVVQVELGKRTYFVRVEEIHSNRVVLSMGSAYQTLPIDGGNKKSSDEQSPPASPGRF